MGNEIFKIDPNELKEHKKASALIPEMTGEEWDTFFENVQEEGIRQPLDINAKSEVLDGRHRLRAALKLGLKKIEVRKHDFTEYEEMKFVRDTAIERRSLTPEQKLNIVLEADYLINDIYEEGRKKQVSKLKNQKSSFSPNDENDKKPHNSIKEIAKLSGISPMQVSRAKKVKRENPEAYEKIVKGEKTISSAYDELPTVKKYERKPKLKRGDANKVEGVSKTSVVEKRAKCQKPPELTKEELDKQWLEARVQTLGSYLMQLENFIDGIDDFDEVVRKAFEVEKDFFGKSVGILEGLTKKLKENRSV